MAWQLLASIGIKLGVWALNKYVLNDTRKAPRPRPEGIEFPLTQIGSRVPIVYGTVRIDTPVLVWIGNQSTAFSEIDQANCYYADMLFVLGVPPSDILGATEAPTLRKFWYGDVEVDNGVGLLHTNFRDTYLSTFATNPAEFRALIEFFDGRDDQLVTNYPTAVADTEIDDAFVRALVDRSLVPGYRNQMLAAVLCSTQREVSGSLGDESRVSSISVEIRARGYDAMTGTANYYEANPAWVIYDLICAPVFKLALPTSKVDLPSFTAVAALLLAESHGVSVAIYEEMDARDILAGILDQIDGVLYEDQADSKIKIRLIRADYDPDDPAECPVLDETNVLGKPQITFTTWADVANQVDVTFTNRAFGYKQDTASAHRLSNAVGQDGRPRPRTVDYPFCATATLAATLAARELAIAARPVITMTMPVNRLIGTDLNTGDPVKVNLPGSNIVNRLFRVADVDQGQLGKGEIELSLIEDVFSQTSGGNGVVVEEPAAYLLPLHDRFLTESPYWMMKRLADVGTISSADLQRIFAIATHSHDSVADGFDGMGEDPTNAGAFIADVPGSSVGYSYHATVSVAYPRTAEPYDDAVGLVVDDATTIFASLLDLQNAAADLSSTYARIGARLCVLVDPDTGDHEFITYLAVSGTNPGPYTLEKVWRGLLDTAPRAWPIGTRLYYLDYSFIGHVGRIPRDAGEMDVQFVPTSSSLTGTGDDAIDSITVVGRGSFPPPVADFYVDGVELDGTAGVNSAGGFKEVSEIDGDFSISGNTRHRTYAYIVAADIASITPEASTTYQLLAKKVDEVEGFTETEVIIAAPLSTPATTGALLGVAGHGEIDVLLRSENGGLYSWTDPTIRFSAAHYRNLLANGSGVGGTTGWTAVTGTFVAVDDDGVFIFGLGNAGSFFGAGVASGGVTAFRQDVDVSGYRPVGLSALLSFYAWNGDDVDDTITVVVAALDASDVVLTSSTSGAVLGGNVAIPSTDPLWKRYTVQIASLPVGTVAIRVTVTLTAVSDALNPDTSVTGMSLRLGQAGAQILSNPTFDATTDTLDLSLALQDSTLDVDGDGSSTIYTLTLTVGGSTHTSVTVEVWIPSSGCSLVYSEANSETYMGDENPGWTGAITQSSGGYHKFVFSKASVTAGVHTLYLRHIVEFGVYGGLVNFTTAADYAIQAYAGSTQVASALLDTETQEIGDLALFGAWSTGTVDVGDPMTFVVGVTPTGQTATSVSVVVRIDSGCTTSAPTTFNNSGGWTIGSWAADPGWPSQWTATLTKASIAAGVLTTATFETTPSTAGTLELVTTAASTDIYTAAGDFDSLTVSSSWTVDATSGKAVPASSAEWTALMAAAGFGGANPSNLWLLQEPSGNYADSIGAAPLTDSSTTNDAAIAGWSRKGFTIADGSGAVALSSAVGDTSTASQLLLGYIAVTATPGASPRDIMGVGNGSGHRAVRVNTTPRLIAYENGAITSMTGGVNVPTTVIPIILQVNKALSTFTVYTETETIVGYWNGTWNAGALLIGAAVGTSAPMWAGYLALWSGANAEMSRANIKTLQTTMGWSPTWVAPLVTGPGSTLIQTTAGAWGTAAANSTNTFTGDGYVEFTITDSSSNEFMIGLSADNPDLNYTGIDFALYFYGGINAELRENGAAGSSTSYVLGDVFKVQRSGTTITARKNGITFATASATSSAALLIDSSFNNLGAQVAGVKLYVTGVRTAITWTSTNVTISDAPYLKGIGAVQVATSGGALSVPCPTTHAADEIAILVLSGVFTYPAPSGWTEAPDSPQNSGGGLNSQLHVYWKRLTSSSEANASIADGVGDDAKMAQILTFAGCPTSGNPYDVTAGNAIGTASTAVSVPGDTTTVANALCVAILSHNAIDSLSPQITGWTNASLLALTERVDNCDTTSIGYGLGVATGIKAAAGAVSATTATLGSAATQGRIMIALKPQT